VIVSRSRGHGFGRGAGLIALLVSLSLLIPASALAHHNPDHTQGPPPAPPGKPVTIQFLNVSDWHGQIDPLDIFGVGLRGGASVISTYWQADRAAHPNSLTLTGGDDFGATPPISNFFDEVPAVLAERMMGIQVGTLGNHNFDRGISHLQQMIDLAGAPASDEPGDPYYYVSANLENRDDNLSGVEDFRMFNVAGIDVAVVGITNPEAPELVFPGSFGTIVPSNPYTAAMEAQAAARDAGADLVVAVTHMGVRGFDAAGAPFGELIDFANNVDGFAVIFGDHTDVGFAGVVNGQLVQENRSKGRTYSRTSLTYQPKAGKVLESSVEFVEPICEAIDSTTGACTATPLGPPDVAIEEMLDPFRQELIPILSEVIGSSTVEIPHADKCGTSNGRSCESLVGNTITDAMRETYETDFAITNSGGIRQPLTCPPEGGGGGFCPPSDPPPYPITVGQVLFVLPFGNQSATLDLTGAQVLAMLENGVSQLGAQGRFPQVSGLCFTYDIQQAAGNRVTAAVFQAEDGSCTGAAVDLNSAASYSITTNDFVASGGDGYPNNAALMVTRDIMANDVMAWVTDNSPISAEIQGRITCTDSDLAAEPACPTVLP
jgi:2',3'-cyclic-nucleotide 2'-phosphodiesterase (5'-nucleotidase family)